MVTRDRIKDEIDKVQDEYLPALYRIVKALEPQGSSSPADRVDWRTFLAETYGSTATAPLEREEAGLFEVREPIERP
jgi:hypothetical protein